MPLPLLCDSAAVVLLLDPVSDSLACQWFVAKTRNYMKVSVFHLLARA